MKSCFILLFIILLSASLAEAQESFPEMNDRATGRVEYTYSPFSQGTRSFSEKKITYLKEQSIYRNASTNELQYMLMHSRDKEISAYATKAAKNGKREFVAFAAIPLGIAAAACIRQNQVNGNWIRPVGIACLAASFSCIIASPVAHHRKAVNYKKAIRLYNLKF